MRQLKFAAILFGATALAIATGCDRPSAEQRVAWWRDLPNKSIVDSSFVRAVERAKQDPSHKQDLIALARDVKPEDAVSLSAAIQQMALDEVDREYLEAAKILDERFPDLPGVRVVTIAHMMNGLDAAEELSNYLFGPSEVEWPGARQAVDGLELNPDWVPSQEIPSFESLIENNWPLYGKVAVVRLLVQRGAIPLNVACSWSETLTVPEVPDDKFLPGELKRLRELCR